MVNHKIPKGGGRPPDVYICESSFLFNEDQFLGVALVEPHALGRQTLTYTRSNSPPTLAICHLTPSLSLFICTKEPVHHQMYMAQRWNQLSPFYCLLTVSSTYTPAVVLGSSWSETCEGFEATQSLWSETLLSDPFRIVLLSTMLLKFEIIWKKNHSI